MSTDGSQASFWLSFFTSAKAGPEFRSFKHGQFLTFDENKNPPLSNLYVSMLQRLGLEADKFGSSTGTLPGLEFTQG